MSIWCFDVDVSLMHYIKFLITLPPSKYVPVEFRNMFELCYGTNWNHILTKYEFMFGEKLYIYLKTFYRQRLFFCDATHIQPIKAGQTALHIL